MRCGDGAGPSSPGPHWSRFSTITRRRSAWALYARWMGNLRYDRCRHPIPGVRVREQRRRAAIRRPHRSADFAHEFFSRVPSFVWKNLHITPPAFRRTPEIQQMDLGFAHAIQIELDDDLVAQICVERASRAQHIRAFGHLSWRCAQRRLRAQGRALARWRVKRSSRTRAIGTPGR
jgi:hypothetical protein